MSELPGWLSDGISYTGGMATEQWVLVVGIVLLLVALVLVVQVRRQFRSERAFLRSLAILHQDVRRLRDELADEDIRRLREKAAAREDSPLKEPMSAALVSLTEVNERIQQQQLQRER